MANVQDAKEAQLSPVDSTEKRLTIVEHPEDTREYGSQGQLNRFLSFKSGFSFGLLTQASWIAVAISFQSSLLNGGPASMVYGHILVGLGCSALAASLAEMASIKPVVGAQYMWTAMFAPRVMSPSFWGFMQGWLTVFAWTAGCALTNFIMGSLMQGLIIINNDNYVPQQWHATLLSFSCYGPAIIGNLFARRILPVLEISAAILHVVLLIVVIAVLTARSQISTTEFVFGTTFSGFSGWSDLGVQWSIGLLPSAFALAGFDSMLHMSDETRNARVKVPRSIFWAVVVNWISAFGFIVCLLFCIGDLEAISASATGYPIIGVLLQATGSKGATTVIICGIIIITYVSGVNFFASVSRLMWTFACDGGMPFSRFFSKVNSAYKIPLNALTFLFVATALLSLIPIGSTLAFTALTSLTTVALYVSYVPPVLLLLIRKLEGRNPKYGPWRLGRWGIPINMFATAYATYIIIFLVFPPMLPVTGQNMNYSGPICLGIILLALMGWFVYGRQHFKMRAKLEI